MDLGFDYSGYLCKRGFSRNWALCCHFRKVEGGAFLHLIFFTIKDDENIVFGNPPLNGFKTAS